MLRAMLAVGFAGGGRRRSELVSMRADDVRRRTVDEPPGWMYEIALYARKTADAADDAKIIPIRGRAAEFLSEWLALREQHGIRGGQLFRAVRPDGKIQAGISAEWFRKRLKEVAVESGIDLDITPHSLRAGYATQAIRDGVPIKDAMAMTDHKTVTVFLGYVEAESVRTSKAGKLL